MEIQKKQIDEEFRAFVDSIVKLDCDVVVFSDGVSYKIKEMEREYSQNKLYHKWDV